MIASRRSLVLGAAAVTASVPAFAQKHAGDHEHRPGAPQDAFAAEMHAQMRSMAEAMDRAPMSGDPDRDFLAMMIPHHQGAIDMARLVLLHGQDPLTRQLADEIVAAQQAEIGSMTARLKELERRDERESDGFPALTGTRGVRPR